MNIRTLIFGLILIFVLGRCNNPEPNKSDSEIFIEKQRVKLVGKWTNTNKNSYSESIYEFYYDSTWTRIISWEDDVRITKGKYILGDDHEVFLRCFGSQHWHSNRDTVEDHMTSIGAAVMFLSDTVLFNNQEDYIIYYKKVKD